MFEPKVARTNYVDTALAVNTLTIKPGHKMIWNRYVTIRFPILEHLCM